jgi:4-hydroxybenzoate polyprenyltransferase
VRNPPARIGYFLALSRAPHAVLDLAMPAAAALLWLDSVPPLRVMALGLLTVFAAYNVVYAANDIADRDADRERVTAGWREAGGYLDAVLVRHPLARGLLTTRQATAWAIGWAVVAIAGSLALNPVCTALFAAGCVLEIAYCRLCCVTPLRAVISGVVKTLGPLAAVFAVDPAPRLLPLAVLFAWVFLVEIGGQNIPSDWTDMVEDRRLGAQTIPARLGEAGAARLAAAALALALVAQLALLALLCREHLLPAAAASLAVGVGLLLVPAVRLALSREREAVFRLFNRASAYPAALVAVLAIKLVV